MTRHRPGEPLRILALRDEFVGRDFDGPGAWWPQQPGVIGGRDRKAGGTWCASDVTTGRTALLVNRIERRDGTPSRGLLPLAALRHGEAWSSEIDFSAMASFNLVLAEAGAITVWIWDATHLHRVDLPPGTHMVTSRGVDADDEKTRAFAPRFAREDWLDVVTSCVPRDVIGALVVRVPFEDGIYATVFGQLITATPGALRIEHTRTPWQRAGWTALTAP